MTKYMATTITRLSWSLAVLTSVIQELNRTNANPDLLFYCSVAFEQQSMELTAILNGMESK